ncbi:RxLR effector protein [Phytophthora megakarya]|uniref:RxLR effector protein n=1 Tax=Phytophthora megakarya TaxID=4795 RepID=A0A225WCA8_9STRA|nr:RxLR effector protein [Phytophthora megakarya]
MRSYQFVLFVLLILVSISDFASASKNSSLVAPCAPTRVLGNNTPIKRLLRTDRTSDEAEEERGMPSSLQNVLKKLSNVFTFESRKTKELRGLLKADESIDDAFKTLKLNNMDLTKNGMLSQKKVVNLFKSRNFMVWSAHVAKVSKLNKQKPEIAMLEALTNAFGEKQAAIMILLSTDAWKRGTINAIRASFVVKKLEKAQFNKWFDSKLEPKYVLERVLKINYGDIYLNPREMLIWANYNRWYTTRIFNF